MKKLASVFVSLAMVLVIVACDRDSGLNSPTAVQIPVSGTTAGNKDGGSQSAASAPFLIRVLDEFGKPLVAANVSLERNGQTIPVGVTTSDGAAILTGTTASDIVRISAPGYLLHRRYLADGYGLGRNEFQLRSDTGNSAMLCAVTGGRMRLPYDRVSVVISNPDGDVDLVTDQVASLGRLIAWDMAVREPLAGDTAVTINMVDSGSTAYPKDGSDMRIYAGVVNLQRGIAAYGKGTTHHELMHAVFGMSNVESPTVTTLMGGSHNVDDTLSPWDLEVLRGMKTRPSGTYWPDTFPNVKGQKETCN
jgi:hypothetical protein